MVRAKKMTRLRVLVNLSWMLLLPVGIGGTQPTGVAQRVFISSAETNRVLRYDGSTIPSATDAFVIPQNLGLAGPRGLVLGPDANLYVISRDTDEVLRYDGETGAHLGTFVLKGSGGLSGPTSLAFGPDRNVYVSSSNTNQVLRYDGTSGAFMDVFVGDDPTTPMVNEAGSLQVPRGMVFGPDQSGDGISELYVSSRDSDEVLLYDGMTGMSLGAFVTDLPLTPFDESGGLQHPTGLTFGPDNHLYVNSFDTTEVIRYDLAGTFVDVFVSNDPTTPDIDESGGLFEPVGIQFGPGPILYVTSFSHHQILSYDVTGAFLGVFVSDDPATLAVDESGGLQFPAELIFDAAGDLLVSSFGSNGVLRYDGITSAFQDVFAPQRPVQIDEPVMPTGLAIDPQGDLYVSSAGTKRILRYNGVTGAFLGVFVSDDPATANVDESGGLLTPAALAFDTLGNLYVSSFENNRVLRYDPSGVFVAPFVVDDPSTSTVDESGGLVGPLGLAFDAAGHLYVSSRTTGTVLSYDTNGVFIKQLVPNSTLAAPAELAFAPGGGDLYVSESGANAIRHFDGVTLALSGTIVADDPSTVGMDESGGLLNPRGLGVSADGSLLVNSSGSDQVLRYDSASGLFLEVLLENETLPEAAGRLRRPLGLLIVTVPPADPVPLTGLQPAAATP